MVVCQEAELDAHASRSNCFHAVDHLRILFSVLKFGFASGQHRCRPTSFSIASLKRGKYKGARNLDDLRYKLDHPRPKMAVRPQKLATESDDLGGRHVAGSQGESTEQPPPNPSDGGCSARKPSQGASASGRRAARTANLRQIVAVGFQSQGRPSDVGGHGSAHCRGTIAPSKRRLDECPPGQYLGDAEPAIAKPPPVAAVLRQAGRKGGWWVGGPDYPSSVPVWP